MLQLPDGSFYNEPYYDSDDSKITYKPSLLRFKFDNFASLPYERDELIPSTIRYDCNGNLWQLYLIPGETNFMSLYLDSKNNSTIDTIINISIKDANGATVRDYEINQEHIFDEYSTFVIPQFIKRSVVLDATRGILKNGAFCIDVGIQFKDYENELVQPKNDHCSKMLALLQSEERADATFTVGGKVFRAHSPIIFAHSQLLGNRCGDDIQDVNPEVFQLLLEHIYTGEQPTEERILEHGKGLIDASNRYELIRLKMYVESIIVKKRVMTIENVSDYILFADAQCCPLLKEYAISFFSAHHRDVLKSEDSKKLKESGELLSEIIIQMNIGNDHDDDEARYSNDFEAMTVNELRKELFKLELDMDGSKEALIARLEETKKQTNE